MTDTTTEVRMTSSTGGQKGSKQARFDLIPANPLWLVAELYGKGAEKYEERNWERGYDWSLSFAALSRHLWAFWSGEEIDKETGLPHLAAVVFHALALMEFCETHREFDNRPSTTQVWEEWEEKRTMVKAILDQLGDRVEDFGSRV